jgi:hypothetical protein
VSADALVDRPPVTSTSTFRRWVCHEQGEQLAKQLIGVGMARRSRRAELERVRPLPACRSQRVDVPRGRRLAGELALVDMLVSELGPDVAQERDIVYEPNRLMRPNALLGNKRDLKYSPSSEATRTPTLTRSPRTGSGTY